MSGIGLINALGEDEARRVLAGCCASSAWVGAVTEGRPYPSRDALLASSDAAVAALDETGLRQALDGHPRIGSATRPGSQSAAEQAGVAAAAAGLLRDLAEANAAYERRFGHIYLVCASGRSAADLLGVLRERLGNDQRTEWGVVAAELAKINRIRLRALLGDQP